MRTRSLAAAFALLAALLTPAVATAAPGVRFLGAQVVPFKLDFQGTSVGGLSGIDYDPRGGEYVLISDDRSYLQPARVYRARIDLDRTALRSVRFTGTQPLRRPDGSTYPLNAIDPEEVRVDPWSGQYWISQEGNRANPTIQPTIHRAERTGAHAGELPLPANYQVTAERGPRQNLVLEAITFSRRGAVLTSAMEGPLLEDGPVPTTKAGALSRITLHSRGGGVLAQHAYKQEPLYAESDPSSPWHADTGVASILADPVDPSRYLVLERTYVPGPGYKARVYEISTRGATDVKNVDSLAKAQVKPVSKRLVLDLAELPMKAVFNIEGMTWGPPLSTGERSLVLVGDDNFTQEEATQVIALALRWP
ncbi:esterase-like activity of phytase family protein [Allokutzneria sp. NRRL B-24872]|uniref:esterase-like activity of phytase family protein n=1 Tax=Allokutzneria sp. NRRL B-24872 TaxID=1137961 RepID=UPI000A38C06E|nr:esterase-like activity of phytase family protein [Allokutzneria sp. NRRL B-24872]